MRCIETAGLLMVIVLSSSVAAEERFANAEGGYSVEFPVDWVKKKAGEGVNVSSPKGDVSVIIESSKLPSGVTVDRYLTLNTESFKKSLNEYNKLGSGVMATPANSEVRWTRFSFKGDTENLTNTIYLVYNMNGRKLYSISCQTKSDAHEGKIAEFDKIVQSFKFE